MPAALPQGVATRVGTGSTARGQEGPRSPFSAYSEPSVLARYRPCSGWLYPVTLAWGPGKGKEGKAIISIFLMSE